MLTVEQFYNMSPAHLIERAKEWMKGNANNCLLTSAWVLGSITQQVSDGRVALSLLANKCQKDYWHASKNSFS